MTLPPNTAAVRVAQRTFRTRRKADLAKCSCGQQATMVLSAGPLGTTPEDAHVCPVCAAQLVVGFLERMVGVEPPLREKVHKPLAPERKAALDEVMREMRGELDSKRLPV